LSQPNLLHPTISRSCTKPQGFSSGHGICGECGIVITVEHDPSEKIWLIDLKKDTHELKHHLEISDADACMANKQCVALGLEIAQLRKNIAGR
jgi:hypothetical protein